MNLVALRSVRVVLTLGLVAVLALTVGVLRASGAFAASVPTVSVTCTTVELGGPEAAAVFSWADASNLGLVIITTGSNTVRLTTSQRAGTFDVVAPATGLSVYASAALYSKPDKSGNVTLLASGVTPEAGCPF